MTAEKTKQVLFFTYEEASVESGKYFDTDSPTCENCIYSDYTRGNTMVCRRYPQPTPTQGHAFCGEGRWHSSEYQQAAEKARRDQIHETAYTRAIEREWRAIEAGAPIH